MINYDPKKKQPMPVGNGPAVEPQVLMYLKVKIEDALEHDDIDRANQLNYAADDIKARGRMGFEKYKSVLRANNGRDQLLDLLEELYDGIQYGFAAGLEGKGLGTSIAMQLVEFAIRVREQLDTEYEAKNISPSPRPL